LKKAASIFLLALLLFAISGLLIEIQPAKAAGTIYIRSDGSIDPPTAPISQSGNKYTLTSSTFDSIVVEKSNIIIDGADLTLQGSGSGNGIDLSSLTGVTVMRTVIRAFENGIYVSFSDHITVSGNTLVENNAGIWLSDSSYNAISKNAITANVYEGIYLFSSSNNVVSGNRITLTVFDGIYLYSSTDNTIYENTIRDNGYGVSAYYSSSNQIFHNNFINNTSQANPNSNADVWDKGYPLGGNYWDDYSGVDLYSGPDQNIIGRDGIGDNGYIIDQDNRDNYPLMNPYKRGDVNYDGNVNVLDLIAVASALGTRPGDPKWNARADVREDGIVNVLDLIAVAGYLGT